MRLLDEGETPILRYRGRPLETLTRSELIEVVIELALQVKSFMHLSAMHNAMEEFIEHRGKLDS